jgi:hypothetical protein
LDYAFRSTQDDDAPQPKVKNSRTANSAKKGKGLNSVRDDRRKSSSSPELSPSINDALYVLPMIAPVFLPHLLRELRHEEAHEGKESASLIPAGRRPMIRIQCMPESRSLCDVCSTSIFMGCYMCGCCGRELCIGCWEEWKPSGELMCARLQRPDQCSGGRHRRHEPQNFVFATQAKEGEIAAFVARVRSYVDAGGKIGNDGVNKGIFTIEDDDAVNLIPVSKASAPLGEPPHLAVPTVTCADLSLEKFQCLWRKGGVPLVLTGLLEKFKLSWDPQYFIENYGDEQCLLHNCVDGSVAEGTVAEFFESFQKDSGTSVKLKDWPPTADFKDTFPDLFEDFENALPYPSYTRRSGPLNLASHFSEGWNAPDLGPKMYNAFPAPDFLPVSSKLSERKSRKLVKEVKGTTNLHLDLTDAVNIMLFADGFEVAPAASTVEKGIPLCGAIWDIFSPSSATAIRKYLKQSRQDSSSVDDPIHRQFYYLSESDLVRLATPQHDNVCSYRIFQNPGDAVFIPAGCPHQVRNRRSCVKVAVDFLSPENVGNGVCRQLVEEARKMAPIVNKHGSKGTGKEDVLQLWTCLGFAWDVLEKIKKQARNKDE